MTDLPADARSKRTNPDKVRRAAADPRRPGAGCKAEPGAFAPVIDHARCEGKKDCVEVCPYDVFEVRVATGAERSGLGLMAQLKSLAHGHKKAFAINPDQCHACGLCVAACPETAIRLLKPRPA